MIIPTILLFSDTKKTEVREFYDDSIPVDEIGEVFDNKYTFYEFSSQAVATEIATDWFPQNDRFRRSRLFY